MGRFKIGSKTTSVVRKQSKPSEAVVSMPSLKLEEVLAEVDARIAKIPMPIIEAAIPSEKIIVEKIIEKVETIKEVKTRDSRARKYAQNLKKMLEIQRLRIAVQDERDEAQSAEIINLQEMVKRQSLLINELQGAYKLLEEDIHEEIQILSIPRTSPVVIGALALSITLGLLALLIK